MAVADLPSPVATPQALEERFAGLDAPALVARLCREVRGRIALVSSFGADSAALLSMAAAADPAVPVLFLDTGMLFPETLDYRDRLVERLGLRDVRTLRPDSADHRERTRRSHRRADVLRRWQERPAREVIVGWRSGRAVHDTAIRR